MDDSAFPKASGSEQKSKRPRIILILVLFLLVLGGILFGASRLLNSKQQEKKDVESAKAAPTVVIAPSDTPSPSSEPTAIQKKPTAAPTKQVSPTEGKKEAAIDSVDKATGLDRASLSIEIQNGSGVSGVAAKMSALLKGLGYVVSGTGNAENFDYTNVTIKVKSTESKYVSLLKKDIAASYTVSVADASLASGSADALVIVGK